MAKKKQSRVVAGQNKARERARRKAHYTGPAAPPGVPEPTIGEAGDGAGPEPAAVAADDGAEGETTAVATAPSHQPAAIRMGRPVATATQRRRASQAMTIASGPSLRSETMRIGIVALAVVAVLVGLKLGTTLGT